MKNVFKVAVIFLMVIVAQVAKSQTLSEVLNDREVTILYLGMDFTKAVIIGDNAANADDIVARQLDGLNDLVINEPKKFDLLKAFRKAEINNDLSIVSKRNQKINPSKLLSSNIDDYNHLVEADVQAIVKSFSTAGKTGIGLLFVMDAMSKPKKSVSAWVTLFDMKTKKILLTDRVEGAVGSGFSWRNYWASGIKKLIDNIESKKYKQWSAQ